MRGVRWRALDAGAQVEACWIVEDRAAIITLVGIDSIISTHKELEAYGPSASLQLNHVHSNYDTIVYRLDIQCIPVRFSWIHDKGLLGAH